MANPKIELSDFIKHLRQQMALASEEGEGEQIRFLVQSMEVELETEVEQAGSGEFGFKVWVANFGAKVDNKDRSTQKIKLTIKPETNGEDTRLNS